MFVSPLAYYVAVCIAPCHQNRGGGAARRRIRYVTGLYTYIHLRFGKRRIPAALIYAPSSCISHAFELNVVCRTDGRTRAGGHNTTPFASLGLSLALRTRRCCSSTIKAREANRPRRIYYVRPALAVPKDRPVPTRNYVRTSGLPGGRLAACGASRPTAMSSPPPSALSLHWRSGG